MSRKHRKFARNPTNWYELDKLLSVITRPLLEHDVESLPDSTPASSQEDSGYFEQLVEDECGYAVSDADEEEDY